MLIPFKVFRIIKADKGANSSSNKVTSSPSNEEEKKEFREEEKWMRFSKKSNSMLHYNPAHDTKNLNGSLIDHESQNSFSSNPDQFVDLD